jgi:uncharacterized protein YlbG (UPF0298 family)
MSDILREVQRARDKVPLPSKVEELFDGPLIRPEYCEHRPALRALKRYHLRAAKKAALVVEDVGIHQAARLPPAANQLSHRYPWAVMWLRRDKEGELKKYKKLCVNLAEAVSVRNRLHKGGIKNATVVSRARSYYIPVELIGRIPKPWVWCPHCMKPRKYRRSGDDTIFAMKKVKVLDRRGNVSYDYRERRVALLYCPLCGCTNRNQVYRMSNQPFHKRRFKQGATRAKSRTKSKLGAGIKRRR